MSEDPFGDEPVYGETVQEGPCAECGQPGTRSIATIHGLPDLSSSAKLPFLCESHRVERDRARAARAAAVDQRRDEAALGAQLRRRVEVAGLPPKWLRAGVPDRVKPAVVEAARRWALGEIRGLLLVGDPGVGKSHVAAWAARLRIQNAAERAVASGEGGQVVDPLRWAQMDEVVEALRDRGTPAHEAATRTIMAPGAVVFDDLDKTSATDYVAGRIFTAINRAVIDERDVLVTMNHSLGQLGQRFGDQTGRAIASRLNELCSEQIRVTGADLRMQA